MKSYIDRLSVQWLAGSPALLLVLLLTTAASARAQDVTCAFVAPAKPLTAGNQYSLWLYCMSNSSNEINQVFEPRLNATLISKTVAFETALILNTNSTGKTAVIAPGGFVKEEYLLNLPVTIAGPVTLAVSNYNPIVILVEANHSEVPMVTDPQSPVPVAGAAPPSELREYFANHMSFYEPIYFILGTYPAAEFQVSLKYKLFDLKYTWNPVTHLYFGYTQTSLWELFSKNPSFYDTSYKPSVFFYYPAVLHDRFFQLDLQAGAEHESNGDGGASERSLYSAYLQPKATVNLPANFQFALQPRAWCYFLVGDNNPNIDQYRGNADLLASLTWTNPHCGEKIQFATKFDIGDQGSHEGLDYILRFNLANVPLLHEFNPALQVQYFTGYGQTLRQYDMKSHALRAGICLWY